MDRDKTISTKQVYYKEMVYISAMNKSEATHTPSALAY